MYRHVTFFSNMFHNEMLMGVGVIEAQKKDVFAFFGLKPEINPTPIIVPRFWLLLFEDLI